MRDDALLIDIVEHAREVRTAMGRISREKFDEELVTRMGIAHLLQIIGEAARQVSEVSRQRFSNVPWKLIVGMRHKIVHGYVRVDFDIVWDTARAAVPELLEALEPTIGPIIDSKKPGNENA